jgi:hypothetical protein
MKIVRLVLVAAILAVSGLVVTHQAPAQANGAYTCAYLNDPAALADGEYHDWLGPGWDQAWEMKAGDTIRLEADFPPGSIVLGREPAANGGPSIRFWISTSNVDHAPFPGTLTYTFASDMSIPAGGYPSLSWDVTYDGSVYWWVSCTPAAAAAAPAVPVPGCDLGMELTPGAAVGTFVWNTDVYWGPDTSKTTGITMPAGKSAWVLGMDETGEFYKFIWSCTYLWAPVGTLGPTYDDTWLGTPLPATVVE